MPDKITAALNEIRARDVQLWDRRGSVGFATQAVIVEGKDDVPRLLAALDAVLTLAATLAAPHAPPRSLYEGGYTDAERQLGTVIREEISRALLGGNGD